MWGDRYVNFLNLVISKYIVHMYNFCQLHNIKARDEKEISSKNDWVEIQATYFLGDTDKQSPSLQ
jgi:hypothetical protein